MHLGGSLEYQFAMTPSREIMSDLARVASSPPVEVMAFCSISEILYHTAAVAVGKFHRLVVEAARPTKFAFGVKVEVVVGGGWGGGIVVLIEALASAPIGEGCR
jgi:hypothetical protein